MHYYVYILHARPCHVPRMHLLWPPFKSPVASLPPASFPKPFLFRHTVLHMFSTPMSLQTPFNVAKHIKLCHYALNNVLACDMMHPSFSCYGNAGHLALMASVITGGAF